MLSTARTQICRSTLNVRVRSYSTRPWNSRSAQLVERSVAFDVEGTCTVPELKKAVGEKFKIPMRYYRLTYSGKVLADDKTLSDYGITKEATIIMASRLVRGRDPQRPPLTPIEQEQRRVQESTKCDADNCWGSSN